MINYICHAAGLSLLIAGQSVSVPTADKRHAALMEALRRGADADEMFQILDAPLVPKIAELPPGVTLKDSQLRFQGDPIAGTLGERLAQMLCAGFDTSPLTNFLTNLLENPSHRVVENLYKVLERGMLPLTQDGCFLAYLVAQSNWTATSGGLAHICAIGAVQVTPRHRVSEAPEMGGYRNGYCFYALKDLAGAKAPGTHVVVCKINPKDVVGVPQDNAPVALRVSRYEAVNEYLGEYTGRKFTLWGDRLSVFVQITEGGENFASKDAAFAAAMGLQGYATVEVRDASLNVVATVRLD